MSGAPGGTRSLIGRRVIDESRRRRGRVFAVVHHGHGIDVLIEYRRGLRRRSWRTSLGCLLELDDGALLYVPGQPEVIDLPVDVAL
jgi:hypothetical protein